jgi:hypothetical protein
MIYLVSSIYFSYKESLADKYSLVQYKFTAQI